jgi:hypothetical protein
VKGAPLLPALSPALAQQLAGARRHLQATVGKKWVEVSGS